MNALQTAVAMAFAGVLAVIIAWLVDVQAQAVFEEEVRAAAQALLDSVANQVRVGVSTALLPGVYGFRQQMSLPSYAPPFDAFYYSITFRNVGGVLVVTVDMTAYRGKASARVSVSRAVYYLGDLVKPEGVVKVYAEKGQNYDCAVGDWVDLTRDGCYTSWVMPSPYYVRYFNYTVAR
ncbi:conserved hypothetical protein [Pyrobaculum islandicum DSM 4184]|uniref:Uncharacterized protein n=2 Tax=Pyrobaculum islandicum TaxID=2277 RepID=A1RTQ0_PYRIL|nr:conserved hypothetical protein [Pyrobaculum islandicum DSM 4184]